MLEIHNDLRPKLRNDIVFGPEELRRAKATYYVKDRYTNQFYRIGEREYFLLNQMDGYKTLSEIERNYEARFGRSLDHRAWTTLFSLIEERQMLEGADVDRLDTLRENAQRKKQEGQGLFRRRFRLVNPDAMLEQLMPWVRFAFRRGFVILGIVAVVALETGVLLNVKAIGRDAWAARSQASIWPIFMSLVMLFYVAHELAHGLTCKYFGGSVNDMGILWRYLWFYPYCKLDDIVLFHNRWHRVYVAFAGTFINLILLLPFGLMWWISPVGSQLRGLSALLLTSYNLISLFNLIPFVQLDGYFMLCHALGMPDLRKDSHAFLMKIVKQSFLGQDPECDGYRRRERTVYLIYGILSLCATAGLLLAMFRFWYFAVAARLGNTRAGLALAPVFLLLIVRKWGDAWVGKVFKGWRTSSGKADQDRP